MLAECKKDLAFAKDYLSRLQQATPRKADQKAFDGLIKNIKNIIQEKEKIV